MPTTVVLQDKDAALIVRADGTFESMLSDQDPNDDLSEPNKIIGMVMIALVDKNLRAVLEAALEKMAKEPQVH